MPRDTMPACVGLLGVPDWGQQEEHLYHHGRLSLPSGGILARCWLGSPASLCARLFSRLP